MVGRWVSASLIFVIFRNVLLQRSGKGIRPYAWLWRILACGPRLLKLWTLFIYPVNANQVLISRCRPDILFAFTMDGIILFLIEFYCFVALLQGPDEPSLGHMRVSLGTMEGWLVMRVMHSWMRVGLMGIIWYATVKAMYVLCLLIYLFVFVHACILLSWNCCPCQLWGRGSWSISKSGM